MRRTNWLNGWVENPVLSGRVPSYESVIFEDQLPSKRSCVLGGRSKWGSTPVSSCFDPWWLAIMRNRREQIMLKMQEEEHEMRMQMKNVETLLNKESA